MQRDFKKAVTSLSEIFAYIDEHVAGTGISPAGVYAMYFVVEELFTNMVKYAPASARDVTIAIKIDGTRLTIQMTDYDVDPFDPANAPKVDPSTPLQERRIGGLGIQLAKQMVDDLQYSYADRCSTITITKNLEP
jgi:anti-sigma regulatory factor (Ser/Thr protein kinase)